MQPININYQPMDIWYSVSSDSIRVPHIPHTNTIQSNLSLSHLTRLELDLSTGLCDWQNVFLLFFSLFGGSITNLLLVVYRCVFIENERLLLLFSGCSRKPPQSFKNFRYLLWNTIYFAPQTNKITNFRCFLFVSDNSCLLPVQIN